MMMAQHSENSARLLLHRLERISADSPWAHQASGVRASLSKCLSRENCRTVDIKKLLDLGYAILEKAAGEIPDRSPDQADRQTSEDQ